MKYSVIGSNKFWEESGTADTSLTHLIISNYLDFISCLIVVRTWKLSGRELEQVKKLCLCDILSEL